MSSDRLKAIREYVSKSAAKEIPVVLNTDDAIFLLSIALAAEAYREADVQAINGVTPKYVAKNAKSRLFAALEGKGDAVVEQQGETGNG